MRTEKLEADQNDLACMLNNFLKNDDTPNFLGSKTHNGLVVNKNDYYKITRSEPSVANLHKIFIIQTWGTRINIKQRIPDRSEIISTEHNIK